MTAMTADGTVPPTALRIDGGMVANNWFCQFLADLLDLPVERPEVTETTALGAACLAGLQAGSYSSLDDIAAQWQCQSGFKPQMAAGLRRELITGWDEAVSKVRTE